jgi:hypothetical protein
LIEKLNIEYKENQIDERFYAYDKKKLIIIMSMNLLVFIGVILRYIYLKQ